MPSRVVRQRRSAMLCAHFSREMVETPMASVASLMRLIEFIEYM